MWIVLSWSVCLALTCMVTWISLIEILSLVKSEVKLYNEHEGV